MWMVPAVKPLLLNKTDLPRFSPGNLSLSPLRQFHQSYPSQCHKAG